MKSNPFILLLLLLLLPLSNCLPTPVATPSTASNMGVPQATTTAIPLPLVDGRCTRERKSLGWGTWHCRNNDFVCEQLGDVGDDDHVGGVCIDRRSPEQVEVDRQEAADGKDGRCSFRFGDGYFCQQHGFVCVDGRRCEDLRTIQEKVTEARLEADQKLDNFFAIFFEGLLGILIFSLVGWSVERCWESWKDSSAKASQRKEEDVGVGREERSEEETEWLDTADRVEETVDPDAGSVQGDGSVVEVVVDKDEELPAYTEGWAKVQA